MARIVHGKGLFPCMYFILCCSGFALFLITITIILSLIPVYLSKTGSDISIDNGVASTLYQATYITNLENATQLMITDTSFLRDSLKSQLHFPKTSSVNILLSEFLPVSSNTLRKKDKRENTCDYDTSKMKGDQYTTQIKINDPNVCHTLFCQETFNNKIVSNAQRYSSLTLPFKLSNGSIITISMVLCKIGSLFAANTTTTSTHSTMTDQNLTTITTSIVQTTNQTSEITFRSTVVNSVTTSSSSIITTTTSGTSVRTTLSKIAILAIVLNDVSVYPNGSYKASFSSVNPINNSNITLLPLNKTLLNYVTNIDNSSFIFEAGREQNLYFRISSEIANQITAYRYRGKRQIDSSPIALALQFIGNADDDSLVIVPIETVSTGVNLFFTRLYDNSQVMSLQMNVPSLMCSQVADSCTGLNYNAYLLVDNNQLSSPLSNQVNIACGNICNQDTTNSACSASCGALCDGQQVAGADTPISRRYDLGTKGASFQFIYQTYTIKDRIRVWNGGVIPLFDSGCVGTEYERTVTLTLSSSDTNVRVDVEPDCDGETGTAWYFTVVCPELCTQNRAANPNPVSLQADGTDVVNGATLYINEQAQMPSLVASSCSQASWTVSFKYTASFSGAHSYVQPSFNGLSSNNQPFDITSALNGQVLGGDVTVEWTITSPSRKTGQYTFKILGKQPARSDIFNYINSKTSLWYAKKIALQESQARQFRSDGFPLYSQALDNGYGIFQLTNPQPTYNQVWNWKANVDQGVVIINSKRTAAINWMTRQRSQAQSQTGSSVPVPNEQVGSNCFFSDNSTTTITDAVAIKQYNGASGGNYCAWDNNMKKWVFHRLNNRNENYVQLVCNQ